MCLNIEDEYSYQEPVVPLSAYEFVMELASAIFIVVRKFVMSKVDIITAETIHSSSDEWPDSLAMKAEYDVA